MSREEAKRRINELVEKILTEMDGEKLVKLTSDLAALVEVYRSSRPDKPKPFKGLYDPTEADITWAKRTMQLMNQGGVLAMPDSGLIYRVDHHQKKMMLQNPDQLLIFESYVTHVQTVLVFAQIGYEVDWS